MTTYSNTATVNDALVISGLSTLGAGSATAPSALIDNTPAGPHGVSYLRGLIRLGFSSPLTATSGAPSITLYRLIAADGTNVPSPPGAAASAPSPNELQTLKLLVASASFGIVNFGPFDLDAFLYGFQFLNNATSGAWSGTVTATLYRWGIQGA